MQEYLTELPTVVWTPQTFKVFEVMQPYFEEVKFSALVTSAKRLPFEQLSIIKYYIRKLKLNFQFLNFTTWQVDSKESLKETLIYCWQMAWSILLDKGIIISPCLKCKKLTEPNKNKIYNQSPHIMGNAFDIGGGLDSNPQREFDFINDIQQKDKFLKEHIIQILLERSNNCVHIGVKV